LTTKKILSKLPCFAKFVNWFVVKPIFVL
jgi:hypothetical protein